MSKAERGGLLFSEWVQQEFPGLGMSTVPDVIWFAEESTRLVEIPADLTAPKHIRQWHRDQQDASAAIWWAEFSVTVTEIPAGVTHPRRIREWHREQQAAEAVPPDAPKATTKPTPRFDTERIIRKGQQAWTDIKATAEETRLRWLEIGNALLIGRQENPGNQAFGKWCEAKGFGDIGPSVRSNAMWLSENAAVLQSLQHDASHPTLIRAMHRKANRAAPIKGSPLDKAEPPAQRTEVTGDTARRVIKTHHRAQAGGEGADIAAKQLEATGPARLSQGAGC